MGKQARIDKETIYRAVQVEGSARAAAELLGISIHTVRYHLGQRKQHQETGLVVEQVQRRHPKAQRPEDVGPVGVQYAILQRSLQGVDRERVEALTVCAYGDNPPEGHGEAHCKVIQDIAKRELARRDAS